MNSAQPVGLLAHFLVDVHRPALLIDLDLHLRAVEIHRPSLEALFLEFVRQIVEDGYRFPQLAGREYSLTDRFASLRPTVHFVPGPPSKPRVA